MRNAKLLVVIDESQASTRAVSYLAGIIRRRRGFKACLADALRGIPAHLIEHDGPENPSEEEKLERELHSDHNQWIVAARKKAQPILLRAPARLAQDRTNRRRHRPTVLRSSRRACARRRDSRTGKAEMPQHRSRGRVAIQVAATSGARPR